MSKVLAVDDSKPMLALKDRAREVRATGWLTKPFDPDQILGLVDQLT